MGGAFRFGKKRAGEERPRASSHPAQTSPRPGHSVNPNASAGVKLRVGLWLPAGPTGRREPRHGALGTGSWPRGPRPRNAGTLGSSVAVARLPLTFSSTQLTMMDGYLRLSQRKNAGTPIAAAQLEAAAWPADERSRETGRSSGRGHWHFLPRAHQ